MGKNDFLSPKAVSAKRLCMSSHAATCAACLDLRSCYMVFEPPACSALQIGNRIKAKGLQKLRWYCQMCGKQCRDENGFKCHLNSDSHKRQMMVFGEAPDRVIEGFSEEFEVRVLAACGAMGSANSSVEQAALWATLRPVVSCLETTVQADAVQPEPGLEPYLLLLAFTAELSGPVEAVTPIQPCGRKGRLQ